MVWSWGVQAESPKSGRDCGRSTSTTEHDITIRKLEHASPHSRGVILERVGSWWGDGGGAGGISKNWPRLWQEHHFHHPLLSMTS